MRMDVAPALASSKSPGMAADPPRPDMKRETPMNVTTRTSPVLLLAAIALGIGPLGDVAFAQQPVGRWLGQDGHDLVGNSPGPAPNDFQDIHLALKGLPPDRAIAEVLVRGHGGGEWNSVAKNQFTVLVVRPPRSASADLYIEPYQRETGREFEIKLKLDDGREATVFVPGGKADPNLRARGAGVEVRWAGQNGHDRTGAGPGVGPDGLEDVHLTVGKLSGKAEVKSVTVAGPGGVSWESGLNPRAVGNIEFDRHPADRTRADLFFSPGRDLAGQSLKVTILYADDRADVASVVAGRCNPAKAVPRPATPTHAPASATARWLGQDGVGTTPGDVHVSLEGLAPGRTIVAAALSDGVVGTWVFKSREDVKFNAGPASDRLNVRRSAPGRGDLAFPPVRDESGATMTLRLLDQSGREEVIRFPGGKADPGLRAPGLPGGTVAARPGDDLNDLANRHGTVTLAGGIYPLSRPIVLNRPVRIAGEPGATLQFTQGADQPPWTAAIKINAGGTTLEGLAVRFAGPVRWDRAVSFGPAVIGTTDDRDQVPVDLKHRITLARLDLQSPPGSSPWEEAPSMIRVISASGGRIERNTFKGGSILFAEGPWSIVDNVHRGTMPGTFSNGLYAGRSTHDLVFTGNRARPEGPSGKAWRFLVLTQRGAHDLIKGNVVEGVGPREDDPRQHENSPEVILTEAYRLHFEGKPASISADGRVLMIPAPQGGPASTGAAVAVLSGPQAGQWRTVAQALGPQSYLLDGPISAETDAVSIATGFVRETFEGNTVDCRGSGIAADLVLAGNLFGVRVLNNKFLGGGETVRLLSTPTEDPVHWGWSHTPFLGGVFEGNTIEGSSRGGGIGVEHGGGIKSTRGRVYMTLAFKDNTIRWSRTPASGKPPRLAIGFPPSLDPKELVIAEQGTKIEGAPAGSAWVHAATVNGRAVREAPLTGPAPAGARAETPSRRD